MFTNVYLTFFQARIEELEEELEAERAARAKVKSDYPLFNRIPINCIVKKWEKENHL